MQEGLYNLSAESAVLGSILYDNRAFFRVEDLLKKEDFYAPAHQAIFDFIQTRITAGGVADGVTARTHFEGAERLEEIGGAGYLAELYDHAAFGPEVPDYARIIQDLARRRELLLAGQELATGAETQRAEDLLDDHERKIEQIREHGSSQDTIEDLRSITLHALQNREERLQRMIKTGFESIDREVGGLELGTLSVLGARPGMGKTVMGICMGGNICRAGGTVGYFSLEMPREDIGFRLAVWEAWIQGSSNLPYFSDVKQARTQERQDELLARAASQDHVSRFLVDDRGGLSINQIKRRLRDWNRHARRMGWELPSVIIVDHMGHARPDARTNGRYERVTEVSNGLLEIAKEFNIAVLALSQLSRASAREKARPGLHDLRDSGAIEQDANLVAFLHRDDYYLQQDAAAGCMDAVDELRRLQFRAEFIIAKARSGPISTVHLKHRIGHNVFFDDALSAQAREAA
jgi:replicative DNA helicase